MEKRRNANLQKIKAKKGREADAVSSKHQPLGHVRWHQLPGLVRWLERNSSLAGILAFLLIFVFYFGIITLANSFPHALQQFSLDWPWIILLASGFGLQTRLHLHLKHQLYKKMLSSSGMAASGGVSGTAMLACCAHHISDALPFLGLAGAAGFLFDYREIFLLFGVLSNFVGIIYLLTKYNEYGLESEIPFGIQRFFRSSESLNFSLVGSAAIFLSYVAKLFIMR
ncbi:MAG: hypothetical protein AABX01_05275 [Candidatus Micrarchaeota archaeon]